MPGNQVCAFDIPRHWAHGVFNRDEVPVRIIATGLLGCYVVEVVDRALVVLVPSFGR